MPDQIIQVDKLGKKYNLGAKQQGTRYHTLRDTLTEGAQQLFRSNRRKREGTEEFWALKGVSFEVARGEVVGIIGRNGAGKSTLLKILSRITEPTEGTITMQGRVASLLEVFTGFHPELTGRENIFLNGAILGMSRAEIVAKFDEIVAFAEIAKFLETPVKRYSSGMYVRLAFAVAAHLEPEILIIDEVLAVGDMDFQKKCLGKMEEVAHAGRTVLFVSHNMAAVQKLCSRALLFRQGILASEGTPEQCLVEYRRLSGPTQNGHLSYTVNEELVQSSGASGVAITQIILSSKTNEPDGDIYTDDPLALQIYYSAEERFQMLPIAFIVRIKSSSGEELFRVSTQPISGFEIARLGEAGSIVLRLEHLPLTAGRYFIDIGVARPNIETILMLEDVVVFQVQPKDVYGSGLALDNSRGLIVIPHHWFHHLS